MSTKYYGYRLKNTSLTDVFNQLRSCYDDCNKIFKQAIQDKFVQYLYACLDNALLKSDKAKKMEIWNVADKYHNFVFRPGTSENIVYKMEICLFPYKKDVLIINYSDWIFNDIIKGFNWEDYSYWNNTDKPEDVSTREWKQRYKVWELVCYDAPANCSLMYHPSFSDHKNYAFCWKYDDLKDCLKNYSATKRLEEYRNNHNYTNKLLGMNRPFKFENIKAENMIDITQDNFRDEFDCILLKENEIVFN